MRAGFSQEEVFLRDNAIFHRLIREICANPMLTAASLSILSILEGHEAGIRYGVAARTSVVGLHAAIANEIIARDVDADAAALAAANHVETAVTYFERRYPKSLCQPLSLSTFMDTGDSCSSSTSAQGAGAPAQVAGLTQFLASELATHITGAVIEVAGERSM
jgi:hypothetical protein